MNFDPLVALLVDCISTLVWTFACSVSWNGLGTVETTEAGFSTHPRCLSLFILFLHSFLVSLLPEEEVLTRLSRGGAAFAVFVWATVNRGARGTRGRLRRKVARDQFVVVLGGDDQSCLTLETRSEVARGPCVRRVVGVAVGIEVKSPLVLHWAGTGGGRGQAWFTDERECVSKLLR